MTRSLDDNLADLRFAVEHDVRGGFVPRDEAIERAIEYLRDDADDATMRPWAVRFTDEAIACHVIAQLSWPAVTDCDRLDRAFAELETEGILSRQNWTCCQTCGHAEMVDEIDRALEAGTEPSGYVFYHEQDTENAVDGGGVCLAYGALAEDADATLRIAERVVATLQRHGLAPEWPGTADKRIAVPLLWQRRRAT